MIICHVTEEQYKEGGSLLDRFSTASPVSETQKLHIFLSLRNDVLSRNVQQAYYFSLWKWSITIFHLFCMPRNPKYASHSNSKDSGPSKCWRLCM